MVDTDVCVVGGGPAGMMLGLLLARDGTNVVVLEKHPDFLRDFRGDTVHPSTLEILDEIGLGDRLETTPHRKVRHLTATFADGTYPAVDFSRLSVPHPYVVFMPQWDFLDLLADEAEKYPTFTLLRSHTVTDLIRTDGVVRGVRATGPDGPVEIHARLTVGTDGRHSTVRELLGLRPRQFGAPMDVLWFRLPRRPEDGDGVTMRVGAGRALPTIDRGDYWQLAYVIPKNGYDAVVAAGLPAFRAAVVGLFPALADRVDQITSWDDVKTLTVLVDRLEKWHVPGALLIGDAAHAMSPIGGVGINLAIQDAVAAANILAEPLRTGQLSSRALAAVQARRTFPTVGTQTFQRLAQAGVLRRVLASDEPIRAPGLVKLLSRFPALQALPARLVGVGLRPEHVSPALATGRVHPATATATGADRDADTSAATGTATATGPDTGTSPDARPAPTGVHRPT